MSSKILTVYFSASGRTRLAAEKLARAVGSDIAEIKPEVPYTSADLNWKDAACRSSLEMKDLSFRPPMLPLEADVEKYDVVFVCFPIWWYIAPTIINTFLEGCKLSGKTVVLFATSGSSGFGKTLEGLRDSAGEGARLIEGAMLNDDISQDKLAKLIEGLKTL